ncbi:MAG: hypothetical protein KF880_06675 [Ferruginibacter sp.]|nr:hypothetical protein [Ferruginibacter sp.]
MSKAIFVYSRDQQKASQYTELLKRICPTLMPDNIQPPPARIVESGHVVYAVINPASSNQCTDQAVCLGLTFGDTEEWFKPLHGYPDGAFCLFRADDNRVEIVSDVVGSRTIWYFKNEEVFIASNSQRAMVALLGNFEFNDAVIPWIMASGTTGPGLSWDKRFRMLEINSSVVLDIHQWALSEKNNPLKFEHENISEEEQEKRLAETLEETFRQFHFDFNKWVLPLSGGVDSRAILYFLDKLNPQFKKLRTITWGLPDAIHRKGNDAFIAKKLADHLGLSHEYYHLEADIQHVDDIFRRFLICGEGRVDAISGYTDGFALWKDLFAHNVEGIIRGEQTFGGRMVTTESDARIASGISLCSDYSNLVHPEWDLPEQVFPAHLQRRPNESLITWRDRLIIAYRAPILKAALNDLKLNYVEVATPLISKGIVDRILTMTDEQRISKSLFKKVIRKMSYPVELATEVAIETPNEIFNSATIIQHFKQGIQQTHPEAFLPAPFVNAVMQTIQQLERKLSGSEKKLSLKARIKKMIPLHFKKKLVKLKPKPAVHPARMAFRTYIICSMHQMLSQDAKLKDKN